MNIKKLLHGALALALTVALIVSSLVFAQAATTVTSNGEFVAAIAAGDSEINIAADFNLTSKLTITQSVKINGGNYTVTCTGQSGEYFVFNGDGTYEISGGTFTTTGGDPIYGGSNFTGTIKLTNGAKIMCNAPVNFSSSAKGTFILDGGIIESSKNAIKNQGATNIQLLSGTLSTTATSSAVFTTTTNTKGTLTIGKPDGTGPTITRSASSHTGELVYLTAATTGLNHVVYGGNFNNVGSGAALYLAKSANLTISGGTFVGGGGHYLINLKTDTGPYNVTITNGDFTGKNGYFLTKNTNDTVKISGGTYNVNPTEYLADGYMATDTDGKFVVSKPLESSRIVTSDTELLKAINDNVPEIIINTTITVNEPIGPITDKTIKFSGTGKVVFNEFPANHSYKKAAINIYNGCYLTFDGPSFELADGNVSSRLMVFYGSSNDITGIFNEGTFKGEIEVQQRSTVTVNGGTFNSKEQSSGLYMNNCFETHGAGTAMLYIKGGIFNSTGSGNCVNTSSSQIFVTGGEFNSTGTGFAFGIGSPSVTETTIKNAVVNTSGTGKLLSVGSGKTAIFENITLNSTSIFPIVESGQTGLINAIGVAKITSGTYNHTDTRTFTDDKADTYLNGGTYNFDPAWMLKGEYVAKYNTSDKLYYVRLGQKVINSETADPFAALQEAINANYSEIKIDTDINATGRLHCQNDKDIVFTGTGTVTFTDSTQSASEFHIHEGAKVVFNGPSFATGNNTGRLLVIYSEGTLTNHVTINKGTFTGKNEPQKNSTLVINGGTFNCKTGSAKDELLEVRAGSNACAYINGGTFNPGADWGLSISNGYLYINGGTINLGTSNAIHIGTTVDSVVNIKGITVNANNTGKIINFASNKTVNLKDVTINYTSGTLVSGTGTLNIISGTYNNIDPTEYVNLNNSTIKQSNGNYIVTAIDKMLRFTNGYNNAFNYYAITNYATLIPGKTYELSIDYRVFGGVGGLRIDPELKTNASNGNGYNNKHITTLSEELAGINAQVIKDNGTNYTLRFTVTDAIADSGTNFRIRLGQLEVNLGTTNADGTAISTKNYSTSIYLGNVSVCEVINGKSTGNNLIENGDFDDGEIGAMTKDNASTYLPIWNDYNFTNFSSVTTMATPENFFTVDDVADLIDLTDDKEDYAVKLEGGDRHELQFRANFKQNKTYQLSFYFRSTGDFPEFLIDSPYEKQGDTPYLQEISTEYVTSGYYKKTYRVTLGALKQNKHTRTKFQFRLGHNSDDAAFYITKVQLYELDANGNTIGENIVGDINPIFTDDYTSDFTKVQMGQSDTDIMNNVVAHGWLGLFNKNAQGYDDSLESDSPENKAAQNVGSDIYGGVAKVDAGFFAYTSATSNPRDGFFNKLSYDSVYDVYIDGKYDILDILIAKMENLGFYGADFQTEILKDEIVNAEDDASIQQGKNIVTIANGESLSKLTGASSGTTVLLQRGGVWRISSTINIPRGVNLGAYGTGEKPRIYGSSENYNDNSWTDRGNNIYRIQFSSNFGNVFLFNKGNENNTKPDIIGCKLKDGALLTSTAQLTEPGDCLTITEGGVLGWGGTTYLYVRLEDGKKPSDYGRIEISGEVSAIQASQNTTIDNISIYYAGRHGITIRSGSSNVTVQNCEIGYTGGSWNDNAPCGNAIEFGVSGTNLTARYNYIYQSYDTGITFQNWETSGVFNGVTLEYNLLTNNFYNIEWWSDNLSANAIQNVVIQNNILKDAGYCWSITQRHAAGNDANFASNIYSGKQTSSVTNRYVNVSIKNNTFDHTKGAHICWAWYAADDSATYPTGFTAEGNVFYQETGSPQQSVQRFGQLDNGSFAFASSQGKFEETMKVFDTTAFARWVVANK